MRIHSVVLWLALALVLQSLGVLADEGSRQSLSETTHKALSSAQELSNKGKHAEAAAKVTAILPGLDKPYELAMAYQMLGYIQSHQENYPKAIEAYRQALKPGVLPPEVTHDLTYQLAQLLIHTGANKEGLRYLEEWFRTEKSPPLHAVILAATAYYQSEQYQQAIPYARKVIASQNPPEESWYLVLVACHVELKQFKEAAEILEKLVRLHPNHKEYWVQLTGVYQRANQEHQALATMELAQARGLLSGDDLQRLAQMYLYLEMPYKAAVLLESKLASGALPRNLENQELLVDSWILSKETHKAAKLLKEMAPQAKDGGHYFRLGQILFDEGDWRGASHALETALNKGHLRQPGAAHLMLGIAAYHTGDREKSLRALGQARNDKNTQKQAEWWIRKVNEGKDLSLADSVPK
jgi:tetratricopeptide (TPR) repeat protein